ncbi:MAG: rod shape-determining protein RodA [Pseudomonadota bacterium]|nr:rod shape-determining protein RodA [Pseudomonadota bacterium]
MKTETVGILQTVLRIPWHILLVAAVLVAVGSMALYSASEGSWTPWAGRHAVRGAVGASLVLILAFINFRLLRIWAYPAYMASIVMLVALLAIGGGSGVARWITVVGFTFQPSEPTKIAVLLALARYFESQPLERMQSLLTYLPPLVMIGVPFLLVVEQPDLGTALALALGSLSVLFIAGLPWRYILASIVLAISAVPVLWSQLHAYQKARVMTFLNPEADQLGAGYQITQSKIALGSGGMFGKGFLMGSQSQLNYLPEKQTDFVFTMIGEEFGLVGNLFILGLYLLLIGGVLTISMRVGSRFAQLTCVGIAVMLFLYVFVNVAMVTGLLPVVGAPLPFISYGGTAMLTVFLGLGIVTSAVVHDRPDPD